VRRVQRLLLRERRELSWPPSHLGLVGARLDVVRAAGARRLAHARKSSEYASMERPSGGGDVGYSSVASGDGCDRRPVCTRRISSTRRRVRSGQAPSVGGMALSLEVKREDGCLALAKPLDPFSGIHRARCRVKRKTALQTGGAKEEVAERAVAARLRPTVQRRRAFDVRGTACARFFSALVLLIADA
jgi:hypothetical protein